MDYLSLPIGQEAPETINAVIEIPGGQANKYEYAKDLKVFRLDRPLYASVHFPGDYGFVPSTLAGDGDPLDILVLLRDPTFPGCLLAARPVGVLRMLDQNVPDEKILAVARSSPMHKSIGDYTDLDAQVLREIEHFFGIYKELEGKHTQVQGWSNARQAQQLIQSCHERFLANRSESRHGSTAS